MNSENCLVYQRAAANTAEAGQFLRDHGDHSGAKQAQDQSRRMAADAMMRLNRLIGVE